MGHGGCRHALISYLLLTNDMNIEYIPVENLMKNNFRETVLDNTIVSRRLYNEVLLQMHIIYA